MNAFFLSTATALLTLAPAATAQKPELYDAETFFQTTTIFGGSFSHDGERLLVTSDESGIFNAHSVDLASAEWQQLTKSESDATFAVSWFPNDDRFLVTADSGGNELNHVYVVEEGGKRVDVTPGKAIKASFAGWREDDQAFFVTTNERDERYFDLYRVDATAKGAYPKEIVFQNEGGYNVSGISRDGRWVALTKVRNNADNDVYLLDTTAKSLKPLHITPHEGSVNHNVMTFTPDNRELYVGSDDEGEFVSVWSYDLAEGTRKPILSADWDVSFMGFSKDGRFRVHGINADARTQVTVLDLVKDREVPLPDYPAGDIGQVRISEDGSTITFYVNGDTSPSNLYVYDVASGKTRRLTDTLSPKMDEADLVESEVIRYPSFDDLEIPALLYRPKVATKDNKVPAVVYVHGGPGGQCRTGYNPTIQHLANHGYAVLAVNNRGSSGYGKTFYHLDDRRHGDVDLKDCIYGRKYLETLPWVDGERVAIMGGSYGGYMVAAALAFAPDSFEAGIDIFGVTNFVRTLEEIPPWWEDFKEALYAEMGDPAKERDRIEAMSPLFHAENITKPLLVVQGANDPRVKQVESDELVAAVKKNDVPVEYVLFEDEGHSFRNKENRIEAQQAYLKFLNRFLQRP